MMIIYLKSLRLLSLCCLFLFRISSSVRAPLPLPSYAAFASSLAAQAPHVSEGRPWVTFSNTSTSMTLLTPQYGLTLSTASGTLISLLDGLQHIIFYGSASGQLWMLVGPSGSVSNLNLPMSWAWNADANDSGGMLSLVWAREGGGEVVRVNVSAAEGARWFDMTFELLAPPRVGSGATYNSLWFPSQPLFNASTAKVFYPLLPGLTLNASFFAESKSFEIPYPGSGTFAEFVHIAPTTVASVSLFTVSGPNYTIPHFKGLYPVPASGANLWRYAHSIQPINVTDGCDPRNGGWQGGDLRPLVGAGVAPVCALGLAGTVRVRIALNGSVFEDLQLYGVANGLIGVGGAAPLAPYGSSPLPSLLSKVPNANATLLRAIARAPLVKVDAVSLGLNFTAYATDLLPALAPLGRPLLYHTMSWEPVAFDHYYPDLLPPNVRFGTGCELAGAHAAMAAAGHLTMPYSNPTWWDPEAPTLARSVPAAGLSLSDVTSLNASTLPIFETYPDTPPATGVVTEITHAFVTARIRALLCQLDDSLDWPECVVNFSHNSGPHAGACNESAVRLHDDVIFEDQLGARHAYADFSPGQAGLGALGFQSALERHAFNVTSGWGRGRGMLLSSEQGYDRMAASVFGFYGNALELSATQYPFMSGNWTLTPVSSALFGASVISNVHNLATTAFAKNLPQACWALASGARLSIDGVAFFQQAKRGDSVDVDFWASAATMQRVVASQWTGYSQTSFVDISSALNETLTVGTGASQTVLSRGDEPPLFDGSSGSYGIATNWANEDVLTLFLYNNSARFALPPRGCMAYGSETDVLGGWVNEWRGGGLLPGGVPHFIAEDRNCANDGGAKGVCLRHSLGPDAIINVEPLPGPPTGSRVCSAVSILGNPLGSVACACDGASGLVGVDWTASIGGEVVDYVFIPSGSC